MISMYSRASLSEMSGKLLKNYSSRGCIYLKELKQLDLGIPFRCPGPFPSPYLRFSKPPLACSNSGKSLMPPGYSVEALLERVFASQNEVVIVKPAEHGSKYDLSTAGVAGV